ncbi:MAG: phospho-N-acetylmuramoyl-pentapeptide-transferase [Candidatus Gastranaerophilales bacterium]|nr:phospho-N-acetylmuramoyl-pentapeptide-transferase [Candidatus Gastranaerophilales bacterium]MCM1073410.1 phospho-N-acetylmuramoyl-pentapeptide-transferase [Bacteroides sp.]
MIIMIAVALLLSMVLSLLFGVPYIDFLRKKTIGQYILDVAPEAHAQKAGTPTTGGVFIIIAIIMASVITLLMAEKMDNSAWIILITLFFMALAGFQDDYLKLKGHENKGLSPRGKLLRQILIALIPTVYAMQTYGTVLTLGSKSFDIGFLYPIFAVFVVTGASNAYNLTDGLDGLAASVGIPAFLACGLIAFLSGHSVVAIVCASVIGASIGFLRYNKPKAQVFMGDTGSLALGGLLGTLAILGRCELLLAIFGGVFVMETLSVIMQVTSFKLTGKRIFKMSPIHHHFELCGHSEIRIVKEFTLVSLILAIVAVVLFIIF